MRKPRAFKGFASTRCIGCLREIGWSGYCQNCRKAMRENRGIWIEGYCPFALCFTKDRHFHPTCPDCKSLKYGNMMCPTCREYHEVDKT